MLCGDLYRYPAERTLNRMPDREKTAGTPESRAKVESRVRETGAQLWIGHDIVGFAKLKKSRSTTSSRKSSETACCHAGARNCRSAAY